MLKANYVNNPDYTRTRDAYPYEGQIPDYEPEGVEYYTQPVQNKDGEECELTFRFNVFDLFGGGYIVDDESILPWEDEYVTSFYNLETGEIIRY